MYLNKWLTFTASCLLQCNTGLSYCFSIYAPHIKHRFNLSQTQLEEIGFAITFGGSFALIPGGLYDALEDYHLLGPRVIIWAGALVCLTGYLGLYLCIEGYLPVTFMGIATFAFLAGNTGTWFDTAALVTNVRNFPSERGTVVGVLKSFVGLSGSLYTSLYLALFAPDPSAFLLCMAVAVPTLSLVLSTMINYVPHVQRGELEAAEDVWLTSKGRFLMAYGMVAALSLYQMTSALLAAEVSLGLRERHMVLGGMLCLLGCLMAVAARSGNCISERMRPSGMLTPLLSPRGGLIADPPGLGMASSSPPPVLTTLVVRRRSPEFAGPGDYAKVATSDVGSPLTSTVNVRAGSTLRQPLLAGGSPQTPHVVNAADAEEGADAPTPAATLGSPELSTWAAIHTPAFWLLFLQFLVGTGAGLAYLNNLGQMTHALGAAEGAQVVLVSLFSVANAAGRLLTGLLPERLLHSHGVPRTSFLAGAALGTAVSCAFTAYSPLSTLYIASLMLGMCFGAHWSLVPSIASDLFGLRHFAANYTSLQIAMMVGSYTLATRLPAWLYDEQARAQGGSGHDCHGPDCFGFAFLLLAGVALTSTCTTLLLVWLTQSVYQSVTQQLHRIDAVVTSEDT